MSLIIMLFFVAFILAISLVNANYTEYIDHRSNEVGLINEKGEVCLSLSLDITLINLNINNTNNKIPFDLKSSTLSGKCAKTPKGEAVMIGSFTQDDRKRKMKFYFGTKNVFVKQVEELRWQLKKVIYSETYGKDTIYFESDNSTVIMSAPLNQKYVCKDKVNITLHCSGYKDMIVEFTPEIDMQPYGPKTTFFICERTRRRTLTESLDNKSTVFSGIILGLSSVGVLIGHSVRRHFIPERKEMYENLGT